MGEPNTWILKGVASYYLSCLAPGLRNFIIILVFAHWWDIFGSIFKETRSAKWNSLLSLIKMSYMYLLVKPKCISLSLKLLHCHIIFWVIRKLQLPNQTLPCQVTWTDIVCWFLGHELCNIGLSTACQGLLCSWFDPQTHVFRQIYLSSLEWGQVFFHSAIWKFSTVYAKITSIWHTYHL